MSSAHSPIFFPAPHVVESAYKKKKVLLDNPSIMEKLSTNEIKRLLPISQCLIQLGFRPGKYRYQFHCIYHDDNSASVVARDDRGTATCMAGCFNNLDQFDSIKKARNLGFLESKKQAILMIGKSFEEKEFIPSEFPEPSRHSEMPKTWALEEKHIKFLESRYKDGWEWVAQRFRISGTKYHISVPISAGLSVFIPLSPRTRENPGGDDIYYRGTDRICQVFPNTPERHINKSRIIVCEGEKDVMRVELELYRKGLLKDWCAITNTMGANSLKEATPLFKNFDKDRVEQILICYDNDEAGHKANQIALRNAQSYFSGKTSIKTLKFEQTAFKGYDLSDLLDERSNE